jgi:hypothetical protein
LDGDRPVGWAVWSTAHVWATTPCRYSVIACTTIPPRPFFASRRPRSHGTMSMSFHACYTWCLSAQAASQATQWEARPSSSHLAPRTKHMSRSTVAHGTYHSFPGAQFFFFPLLLTTLNPLSALCGFGTILTTSAKLVPPTLPAAVAARPLTEAPELGLAASALRRVMNS